MVDFLLGLTPLADQHDVRWMDVELQLWADGSPPVTLTAAFSLLRQWLPRSKMAPFQVDQTLDKLKLTEARSSYVRKAVRLAFDGATNHLHCVGGEPEPSRRDWTPPEILPSSISPLNPLSFLFWTPSQRRRSVSVSYAHLCLPLPANWN